MSGLNKDIQYHEQHHPKDANHHESQDTKILKYSGKPGVCMWPILRGLRGLKE